MTSDRTGSQTDGYDGDGLRAWKQEDTTQTYFLYDGADPVCEFDGTGTLAAVNTFGADGLVSRRTAATSTSVFYLFDEHGNVAQRTSKTGAVTGSDLFDTYGTRSGTASTQPDPFGFEGQAGYYTDTKTGLILCTHRFYDPAQGRFLTRDPLGYEGGINLYGYTANNPVNESDPSGLIPPLALAGGGVVVTGATGGEGLAALGAASWPTALGAVVLAAGYGLGTGATWIGNHIANGIHAQDGLPAPIMESRRGSRNVGTLRREWERLNNQPWPTDANGKRHVCEHKVPLADGGVDDGSNVEPLDEEVHKQRHKDRGDFQRWGGKRNTPSSDP